MRILGPNCLGHFNTRNKLYATFTTSITHGEPQVGSVGLVSQSGAFGSHCFVLGRERGLGFSCCVTTGNEVDITVAECLAYLAMDDHTDVLAVYMEGCKNGEQFMAALALAEARGKPVVIQKVGRSEVGTAAAASHTASLTGADKVYDAVFERYNAYRADTTSELIDIAYMLSGMRRVGKNSHRQQGGNRDRVRRRRRDDGRRRGGSRARPGPLAGKDAGLSQEARAVRRHAQSGRLHRAGL